MPGMRLLECQHTQHSGQAPRQEPCTDLRMARETFCFQGLSLRIPIPKPERKKSSPVVTRSHFWEASNSSTAESQMKAWSLLHTERGWTGQAGQPSWAAATVGAARTLPALIQTLKPPSLALKEEKRPEREAMARARAPTVPFPTQTLCCPPRDLGRAHPAPAGRSHQATLRPQLPPALPCLLHPAAAP